MENTKRLYRSRKHKVIGGVAGGLAEYFNVDVILIRLLFVIIFFAGGGGVLIYLILWIITPQEPLYRLNNSKTAQPKGHENFDAAQQEEPGNHSTNNRTFIAGIILILIGFLFLLNTLFPAVYFINFWPVLLIIIGAILIINEVSQQQHSNNSNNNEPLKTEDHEI